VVLNGNGETIIMRLTSSVTIAGAIMLIATFAILVLYFVISTPMASMFDAFDDADAAEATNEMNLYLPFIKTAFYMGFAIAIITPALIFIFWIFHREPDWYYRS